MISGTRNFLWILPLLLLVTSPIWKPLAVGFLSPHSLSLQVQESASSTNEHIQLRGVSLTRSENGQPEMFLRAEEVKSGTGGMDEFYFKNIAVTLLEQGKTNIEIAGGEGHYDAIKGIVTVVDDVSVLVRNEYELYADALRYLVPYKTLKTASDIFFKSKDASVRGTSMSYNLSTGNYRVGSRVICDFNKKSEF
ncbi:MAG: LPS export ABC transporter periplasmic protein LptC [Desulfobulbaceae bacterium]|nr:LPS export ABC transporter periplasmic protein LptC [Desulfobulbaceae bacterium]